MPRMRVNSILSFAEAKERKKINVVVALAQCLVCVEQNFVGKGWRRQTTAAHIHTHKE